MKEDSEESEELASNKPFHQLNLSALLANQPNLQDIYPPALDVYKTKITVTHEDVVNYGRNKCFKRPSRDSDQHDQGGGGFAPNPPLKLRSASGGGRGM